jgi:mannosyltransferase OCH1-like enzyme
MIPNILHFIWIDKNTLHTNKIPDKYNEFIGTWKKNAPDLEIKIWFYNDILQFIKNNFEDNILQFFINMDQVICKCDFARFLIIYKYGGIYSDLDFYCRKNIYSIIKDKNYFLVPEPIEHQKDYKEKLVYNGIFAFAPNHPFVKGYINHIYDNYKPIKTNGDVIKITGPAALGDYYSKNSHDIKLDNYCLVTPYTKFQTESEECFDPKSSYTYTNWNEGSNWNVNSNKNKYIIIGSLILIVAIFLISRLRR